jgi:hypothetical protein
VKLFQENATHCGPRAEGATALYDLAEAVRATEGNVGLSEAEGRTVTVRRPATRRAEQLMRAVRGYYRPDQVYQSIPQFASRARRFSCATRSVSHPRLRICKRIRPCLVVPAKPGIFLAEKAMFGTSRTSCTRVTTFLTANLMPSTDWHRSSSTTSAR